MAHGCPLCFKHIPYIIIIFRSYLFSGNYYYWPPAKWRGLQFQRPLSVCMYVCQMITFQMPWCTKFIFAHSVYLRRVQIKFIYEGHWVKVMVTRAEKRPLLSCHPYASKSTWIQLPRWRAHHVIQGWYVNMMTENSRRHICPTYCMHAFAGGHLRLEGSFVVWMLSFPRVFVRSLVWV